MLFVLRSRTSLSQHFQSQHFSLHKLKVVLFLFFFYRPLDLTEAVPRITETSSHLSLGHCAQCRERGVAVGGQYKEVEGASSLQGDFWEAGLFAYLFPNTEMITLGWKLWRDGGRETEKPEWIGLGAKRESLQKCLKMHTFRFLYHC